MKEGILLAIDTATRVASLALYDGDAVLAERSWRAGRRHTVELMPNLIDILAQARVERTEISVLAVAQGPGSFTGLRIGLSVAKGMASALGIPVIAVRTLDILAYPHYGQLLPIAPVIQAGRGRLCYAIFRRVTGRWRQTTDYHLASPEQLGRDLPERILFCGELDRRTIETLKKRARQKVSIVDPAGSLRRAGYLAELAWARWQQGEMDSVDALTPIYIRTHGS
jgi:tRNA threonylcarbamoyladenosine biosynthesis protein TsaB